MQLNGPATSLLTFLLCAHLGIASATTAGAVEIRGTDEMADVLMRWHRVSLTFDGPATSETAKPNPWRRWGHPFNVASFRARGVSGLLRFVSTSESWNYSTARGIA